MILLACPPSLMVAWSWMAIGSDEDRPWTDAVWDALAADAGYCSKLIHRTARSARCPRLDLSWLGEERLWGANLHLPKLLLPCGPSILAVMERYGAWDRWRWLLVVEERVCDGWCCGMPLDRGIDL
ncbi:hypothetical protein ACLOJK_006567 [Asimina triloba]